MVGYRITALRKKAGLSQDQLAKQINVCASAIGMYEQGRREPSIKTLVALSQVFGVSLDYLITGTDSLEQDLPKIAGVLFILRADLPGISDTILLNEEALNQVMPTLQQYS